MANPPIGNCFIEGPIGVCRITFNNVDLGKSLDQVEVLPEQAEVLPGEKETSSAQVKILPLDAENSSAEAYTSTSKAEIWSECRVSIN